MVELYEFAVGAARVRPRPDRAPLAAPLGVGRVWTGR